MAENGPGLSVLAVFADARAYHFGADEGGDTAYHVYGGRACKIVEAELAEPPPTPDPVAGNGIDDGADGKAV